MNKDTLKAALAFMLIGMVTGVIICALLDRRTQGLITERDTTTYIDIVPYYYPIAKDSTVVRYVTQKLPVSKPQKNDTSLAENYAQNNGENIPPQVIAEERDSVAAEIPITQKKYEGDDYLAYVSGYQPSLDSIFVYAKTTTITERSYKPPNKWHIGITGGYGYGFTSKKAEPFIGIGITYSVINF